MIYSWEIILDRAVERFARFIKPSENPSIEETLALGILSRLSDLNELDDADKAKEVADFRAFLDLLMDEYKKDDSRYRVLFRDAIFSALIAIALASPLNLIDPCSQDEIEPENRIATADGFQFDIHYLAGWIKSKGEWINPLTRGKFTSRDKVEIRAFAIAANVDIDLTHVVRPRDERIDLTNQEITRMLAQDDHNLAFLRARLAALQSSLGATLSNQRSALQASRLPGAPNPVVPPPPPLVPQHLYAPRATAPTVHYDARSRVSLSSSNTPPSMAYASPVPLLPQSQSSLASYLPRAQPLPLYVPSALSGRTPVRTFSLPAVSSQVHTQALQRQNVSLPQASYPSRSMVPAAAAIARTNLFATSSGMPAPERQENRNEQKYIPQPSSHHVRRTRSEREIAIAQELAASNARLAIIRARRLLAVPITSVSSNSPSLPAVLNQSSSVGVVSPGSSASSLFAPAPNRRPGNGSQPLTLPMQLPGMTMSPTDEHSALPRVSRYQRSS